MLCNIDCSEMCAIFALSIYCLKPCFVPRYVADLEEEFFTEGGGKVDGLWEHGRVFRGGSEMSPWRIGDSFETLVPPVVRVQIHVLSGTLRLVNEQTNLLGQGEAKDQIRHASFCGQAGVAKW